LIQAATLIPESAKSLLILLGLTFLVRLALPGLTRLAPRIYPAALGGVFGVVAIGAMQAAFPLADRISGAAHNIVLVAAGVLGGPWAALIAGATAALYRATQGGLVAAALLGIAGAVGLGILYHRWRGPLAGRPLRVAELLGLGAVLAVVNAGLPVLTVVGDPVLLARAGALIARLLPILLVLYPVGVLALCAFLHSELKRVDDERALKDANEALKGSNEALHESEARFRDFASVASDWLWETDADHRFTFVSPSRVGVAGTAGQAALGRTRWDFVGADPADPVWQAHIEDLVARRPFADFEYARVDETGQTHWIRVNGRPYFGPAGAFLGYRGAATDRTAQKRMEMAAEESDARLRAFIDNMPDLISLKDAKGRFLVVNRRFGETHGADSREIIGKVADEVLPPDEAAMSAAAERAVRATGQPLRREVELTLGGSKRSAIVVKFPIAQRNDPSVMIGTIITDVTEFKRLREQLHYAQKMETVGQLTGGIAHDFNNLLTVVLGNTELLIDHLQSAPELLRLAETARGGATRAAELTRRLLAFSRRQALKPAVFDLNHLVTGMTGLLQRTLGEQVELRTRLVDDLWPALADPAQVESVVLNLAVNARDAMAGGGQLTISTGNVELDEAYARAHEEVKPGPYALLSVTDTGSGMAPEVAARAFEPFFTTKEVGKGTGLGLSMVYGFLKQSGGHVALYSELGLGTTVNVYLPRAEAGAASPAAGEPRALPVTGGKETLLVVEDDAMVRAFVIEQLRALGYAVVEASSGAAALTLLDSGRPVDLLFTDVVMPGGMTGFELADAAHERRPGLRILFTSGYAEEAMRQQGRLRPGMQLLSKPYPKAALAAAIRALLDRPADES
jgi:PAS domain S-box-containing protein